MVLTKSIAVVAGVALWFASPLLAVAQTGLNEWYEWKEAQSGEFRDAANWEFVGFGAGGPWPGSRDVARFRLPGEYSVQGISGVAIGGALVESGKVTLQVGGNDLTLNESGGAFLQVNQGATAALVRSSPSSLIPARPGSGRVSVRGELTSIGVNIGEYEEMPDPFDPSQPPWIILDNRFSEINVSGLMRVSGGASVAAFSLGVGGNDATFEFGGAALDAWYLWVTRGGLMKFVAGSARIERVEVDGYEASGQLSVGRGASLTSNYGRCPFGS